MPIADVKPKSADPPPAFDGTFEEFVAMAEPRLRRALVAAYGPEQGRDAAAEALAYAFEHWDRFRQLANLPGYLFRVGQTRGRRQPVLHERPAGDHYRPAALHRSGDQGLS